MWSCLTLARSTWKTNRHINVMIIRLLMYQYFFHSMLTDKNYRITADFTFDTFCSDKTTYSYFVNLFANTPKHNISIRCKIKIGHQWKNEIISTNDWMLSGVLWKMCIINVQTYARADCDTAFYKWIA